MPYQTDYDDDFEYSDHSDKVIYKKGKKGKTPKELYDYAFKLSNKYYPEWGATDGNVEELMDLAIENADSDMDWDRVVEQYYSKHKNDDLLEAMKSHRKSAKNLYDEAFKTKLDDETWGSDGDVEELMDLAELFANDEEADDKNWQKVVNSYYNKGSSEDDDLLEELLARARKKEAQKDPFAALFY